MSVTLAPEDLVYLRMSAQGLTATAQDLAAAEQSSDDAGDMSAGRTAPEGASTGPTGPNDTNAEPTGTSAERIAETARRMLAIQSQDWRAARWALGVRTPGSTVNDVHDAFARGLIVRSWPMRGTIHVVAAEDIGWMQQVTNQRVLAGAPKRREFLGLDDATLDRLVEVSLEALRGQSLSRDELSTIWTEAGIGWRSNWRYHVVWWLCQNGLAVFGPVSDGGEPRLVRVDEWIEHPRKVVGDDALAEFATRYVSARGAVSAKDLAWWSGLTMREAKLALSLAREAGNVIAIGTEVDGRTEMWADPRQLHAITASPQLYKSEWLLLPAFDEHLLGYQDRSAQLDPEHFERIVPGRNGMFLATVVYGGRVVGTWKRGTKTSIGVVATPLPGQKLSTENRDLQARTREWLAFHGRPGADFALATSENA